MSKKRYNGKQKNKNLETLCLDCGLNGYLNSTLENSAYFDAYTSFCPKCDKNTRHIKCNNLDLLRSKLEFMGRDNYINNMVLNALREKEKEKVYRK